MNELMAQTMEKQPKVLVSETPKTQYKVVPIPYSSYKIQR